MNRKDTYWLLYSQQSFDLVGLEDLVLFVDKNNVKAARCTSLVSVEFRKDNKAEHPDTRELARVAKDDLLVVQSDVDDKDFMIEVRNLQNLGLRQQAYVRYREGRLTPDELRAVIVEQTKPFEERTGTWSQLKSIVTEKPVLEGR
ncbi:MAG: hypothetical protein WAZ18_02310 [Alphaproteobacteria bacterium]